MEMQDILFTIQGHLGLITLNRAPALNALTLPMIQALKSKLVQWENDKNIHAIIIQAVPGKAFCAGGDVRWLYNAGLEKNPEQLEFFREEYRLNYFIHQLKTPYLALMNGFTMGGGVGISLHGSHRVASEQFIFSMPETAIGLFPDIGASYLLSRCPGKVGLYLALTGRRLNAAAAHDANLVDYVIDYSKFPLIVEQLSKVDLSNGASEKINHLLNQLAIQCSSDLGEQLIDINYYFSGASIRKILDRLKQSNNTWALAVVEELKQKSPMSLMITFEQMAKARQLTMEECIKMDYCLIKHFIKQTDFYEGVRALLIDKDNHPIWKPSDLTTISSEEVANYFEYELPELDTQV